MNAHLLDHTDSPRPLFRDELMLPSLNGNTRFFQWSKSIWSGLPERHMGISWIVLIIFSYYFVIKNSHTTLLQPIICYSNALDVDTKDNGSHNRHDLHMPCLSRSIHLGTSSQRIIHSTSSPQIQYQSGNPLDQINIAQTGSHTLPAPY